VFRNGMLSENEEDFPRGKKTHPLRENDNYRFLVGYCFRSLRKLILEA